MFQPGTGTVVFGRYRLRRELARGSMGSVWMAQDQKLHRAVAVKLMAQLLHDSTEARLRFEREAMAVAQLQSPHVVQIYDYGIESGCPFIVMELLEGEDVRARLRRRKRLDVEEVRPILVQTCKALSAAHAAGIIHRDLKPANLFLAESRDEEILKILDFGVAKADPHGDIEQETTKQGALLGTPQYMSPEQARAEKVDHRSDLWSLGVIVYRMLTGQVPFQGRSLGDIIIGICTKPLPPATGLDPDLPPQIDEFFARALARDPDQRFATARDMAAAYSAMAPASYPSLSMPFSIGAPLSSPGSRLPAPRGRALADDPPTAVTLRQGDDQGEKLPHPLAERAARDPARLPPLPPASRQRPAPPEGARLAEVAADVRPSPTSAASPPPVAPPSGPGVAAQGVSVASDDEEATRFMGRDVELGGLGAPAAAEERALASSVPLDAAYDTVSTRPRQRRVPAWLWAALALAIVAIAAGAIVGTRSPEPTTAATITTAGRTGVAAAAHATRLPTAATVSLAPPSASPPAVSATASAEPTESATVVPPPPATTTAPPATRTTAKVTTTHTTPPPPSTTAAPPPPPPPPTTTSTNPFDDRL